MDEQIKAIFTVILLAISGLILYVLYLILKYMLMDSVVVFTIVMVIGMVIVIPSAIHLLWEVKPTCVKKDS